MTPGSDDLRSALEPELDLPPMPTTQPERVRKAAIFAGMGLIAAYTAVQYARGRSGWGWEWKSDRARRVTAGVMVTIAGAQFVQAADAYLS